jgi:hypothetical protein
MMFAGDASPSRAAEGAALGQGQWVPSLAITSGVLVGDQAGDQRSFLFDGETGTTSQLRKPAEGDDRAVTPYVGGAVEILSPALLPHVRFFAAGEVLPTFGPERQLAQEGQASRIRGPDVGAVLAGEEDSNHFTEGKPGQDTGPRPLGKAFGQKEANGQGMRTTAQLDQLAFGAKLGVSFSFEYRGREIRIKPSIGWIHYKVAVKGYMVNPTCLDTGTPAFPNTTCTNTYDVNTHQITSTGVLRESILSGHDSGTFDGIGPGVDLEMQTGRLGPLGTALFIGLHGYYQPGDRDIDFSATKSFSDTFGNDTNTAFWHARVAPWIYRAGVGFRLQWLGSGD